MGNPPSFNNFATDPLFTSDKDKNKPAGLGKGSIFYATAVPNISFGGGQEPNEAGFSPSCSGQCPYSNWNDIYSVNDTLSKVWGKHNIKTGFYYEKTGKVEIGSGSQGSYLGSWFRQQHGHAEQRRTASPTLAGISIPQRRWAGDRRFLVFGVEAFVQDNWRVNRRVTVGVGIRFNMCCPR
jgi:hypothetical protein